MATILFVAKGTGGDLAPFPKIAEALKKRGHQVTLLSHCTYAGLAQKNGCDFIALDTPEQRQQMIEDGHLLNSPSGYPAYFRRHIFPGAVAEYEAIRQRWVPGNTVLVSTHKACLVPLLAKERLGIPLVRLFATLSELITLPLMEEMYSDVLSRDLNDLRAAVGLQTAANQPGWLRQASQELALWPAWFTPAQQAWPVQATRIGFVQEAGGEIPAAAAHLLKKDQAPILITAGTGLFTDPKFYAASAGACQLLDRPAILVTKYPQLVPHPLPDKIHPFTELPFADVMPHAAAIIHHGGVGTLACAMSAGIPQLVLAAGGDRPLNGMRIQQLGVGETLLPLHWQAKPIAAALHRLLDSTTIHAQCRALALRLQETDAATETCKWIELHISKLQFSNEKNPSFPTGSSQPMDTQDPKVTAAQRMQKLSPEKQALLAQRLREKRGKNPAPASPEQGIVTGPLPVVPVLLNNYADSSTPQEWWQTLEMLVEIPHALGESQVREAVQQLVNHHDGLRLRLLHDTDGYQMFIAAEDDQTFAALDVSGLEQAAQDSAIENAIPQQWASLNLATGPLFRVVFFDRGTQRPPCLLVVLHHFAADAYSKKILLHDFQVACQALVIGEPLRLHPKTSSLKHWAEVMAGYAHTEAGAKELEYWQSLPWGKVRPTPMDHPEVSESPYAHLTGSLSVEETQALLSWVAKASHIQIIDVLLMACFVTYAKSDRMQTLAATVLHHGRNIVFADLDVSRTVGNLYAPYPLILDLGPQPALADPQNVLEMVARQRACVPHEGATSTWVAYPFIQNFLSLNIVFNYLGPINPNAPAPSRFFHEIPKQKKTGDPSYQVRGATPHSCSVVIENGRLKVDWEYFTRCDEPATIERLIQGYLSALRSML